MDFMFKELLEKIYSQFSNLTLDQKILFMLTFPLYRVKLHGTDRKVMAKN